MNFLDARHISNLDAETAFEIFTEWGSLYKGWIIPLHSWNHNQVISVLSLFDLKNILQDGIVKYICVSISDPMYIRIVFNGWLGEDYKAVQGIQDWLIERADAARSTKKLCWQKVGF